MNAFVAKVLENLCACSEIFAEESDAGGGGGVFVRFEEERGDCANDGLNSRTLFGRVVYSGGCSDDDGDADGGERVSGPLMLKTMPAVCLVKDLSLLHFSNEISFYTVALPLFQQLGHLQPLLLPKFYASQTMFGGRAKHSALLVFEDLRARGFRMADARAFLDLDHLSLMLRALGNFHAYSYRAKAENPLEFQALAKWFYDTHNLAPERMPNFLGRNAQRGLRRLRQDAHYSRQMAAIERIVQHADQFMNRINNLERKAAMSVLCHGDYLRGNVMFRYDECSGKPCQLKMVDMACCRVASPVVDLSTVLYLNADQATRRRHWRPLIDAYHHGLCEPFGADTVPSVDHILGELHTKCAYAYIVASYFLPTLVALDRGTQTFSHLLGEEWASCRLDQVPEEMRNRAYDLVGGDEATEAVVDILRDMIDRGFL